MPPMISLIAVNQHGHVHRVSVVVIELVLGLLEFWPIGSDDGAPHRANFSKIGQ